MAICGKSGLKSDVYKHLSDVMTKNILSHDSIELHADILDSLAPGNETYDSILKPETIEKCKKMLNLCRNDHVSNSSSG